MINVIEGYERLVENRFEQEVQGHINDNDGDGSSTRFIDLL